MKKCRGYFKHACDNAAVTIASNYHTHFPVKTVKRYSKAEKKHVDITEPNIIRQYNKYMGDSGLRTGTTSNHVPKDDVQFAKETAEMNVFSAEKGYTEIVFRLITA
ncbi:hypothetical protein T03_13569 [Trichinella britovi]|uniref:PiggyBac transposable element-derived protein domain-containing protein n=1 Tax=Trichinella britovi TaxID=45882 RepID=A0A0V1DGZ0_TRIBR|nr:hypothetical protein T03_13569 [Trichinella britovi]